MCITVDANQTKLTHRHSILPNRQYHPLEHKIHTMDSVQKKRHTHTLIYTYIHSITKKQSHQHRHTHKQTHSTAQHSTSSPTHKMRAKMFKSDKKRIHHFLCIKKLCISKWNYGLSAINQFNSVHLAYNDRIWTFNFFALVLLLRCWWWLYCCCCFCYFSHSHFLPLIRRAILFLLVLLLLTVSHTTLPR